MIASVDESVGRVLADARRAEAGREHAGDLHQRQRRRRRLRPRGDRARPATSPTTPRCAAARGCSTKAASACRSSSAGRARSPAGTDLRRADHQRRSLPHAAGARRRPSRRRSSRSTASATCRLLTGGGKATLDREAIYWHFPGYLGRGRGTLADHARRRDPGRRLEADGVLRGRPAGAVQPAGRPGREDRPRRGDAGPGRGPARAAARLAAGDRGPDAGSEQARRAGWHQAGARGAEADTLEGDGERIVPIIPAGSRPWHGQARRPLDGRSPLWLDSSPPSPAGQDQTQWWPG